MMLLSRISFILWLGICLLFLQTALTPVALSAQAASDPAAQAAINPAAQAQTVQPGEPFAENSPPDIWLLRAEDLAAVIADTDKLMQDASGQIAALSNDLQNARSRLGRLAGLFQASRGHPTEQLTMVRQMYVLRDNLEQRTRPLGQLAASVARHLSDVTAARKDFETLRQENAEADALDAASPAPDAAFAEPDRLDGHGKPDEPGRQTSQDKYLAALALAEQRLTEASGKLDAVLTPAGSMLVRLKASVTELEQSLGGIWEGYYLTPADAELDALSPTTSLLAAWLHSLNSRFVFAYPHSAAGWLSAAKSFAVTLAVMALLGFLALRGARILPPRWRSACEAAIRGAWVLAAFGLAILTASINQSGGFYFGFIPPGTLLLIFGAASLAWRLRVAVLPVLKQQSSPLRPLYLPAVLGVLLLFSDLPARVLGLFWDVIMLVFLILIFRLRRGPRHEATPPLERFSQGCALYFGLASLLVAFLGYSRLAILVFMALFALINLITLASALMELLRILMERLFPEHEKPLRSAIAQALGIPLAWLLSLVCALPWIWAVPGAYYLMRGFASTNYTVGEASFNFSRLLFIVLLFFIARALIKLGHASLSSLPKRLPQLEHGVIPPLRVMFRYLVWTLFAIAALGLLDVNLTSLAVVAGGLSVGVGLGMQNIFNNLTSGLMLIFGRSVLVGDWIEVNGVAGTVKEVNIRSTVLETAELSLVYLPNSSLIAGQFTNWTRGNRAVRKSLLVGVNYGADTALAAKLLLACAQAHPHVLKNPPAAVYFDSFADSALTFKLNVFVDDFDNAPDALSELHFKINEAFKANGIEIPFPQLDVHISDQAGARHD